MSRVPNLKVIIDQKINQFIEWELRGEGLLVRGEGSLSILG